MDTVMPSIAACLHLATRLAFAVRACIDNSGAPPNVDSILQDSAVQAVIDSVIQEGHNTADFLQIFTCVAPPLAACVENSVCSLVHNVRDTFDFIDIFVAYVQIHKQTGFCVNEQSSRVSVCKRCKRGKRSGRKRFERERTRAGKRFERRRARFVRRYLYGRYK